MEVAKMLFSAHRRSMFGLVLAATLPLSAAPAPTGASVDWPHFRGPAHGGSAGAGALPRASSLEVAWRKKLGSGYSGISVAGGKLVTAFASGGDDVLVALDAASGEELWRLRLGEKYAGHDGSHDGPISTPAIDGGVVYALGPRGALVAASLEDGRELWRVQLDAAQASLPFYGFTASPLLWEDLLILPTGGENHAVTAFGRQDGKLRWTAESGEVAYQSASLFELAGRQQLVVVANQWLGGLDPATGKTLWKFAIAAGNASEESAHATPAGGNRLLVDLQGSSLGLEVAKVGDGFAARELYRTQAFANTLSLPVHHDGVLYGFTGRFLTAADAGSGEILWRSRPPGGSGLTLVDGKLAVVDAEGELVLAEAHRTEYRELARVKALENGNYVAPAFAGGHFFVRNLAEIAAVRPAQSAAPAAAKAVAAPPQELRGEFGRWLATVKAADAASRQAMVDAYFAKVAATPILEPGLAHIVFRGQARDVAVAGTFLADEEIDRPLEHVAATDLFFRSEKLDNDGIWSYGLVVDFGTRQPDPRNPITVPEGAQMLSELRMPGVPPTPYLAEPAEGTPRGSLDTFRWHDEKLGNTRRISVYLPPGYDASAARFPVLVVNHGDRALLGGRYQVTLDNLIAGKKIEPLIAVFVPRLAPEEYSGLPADDYVEMLVAGVLPHVDRHYRTDPRRRSAIGVGTAGVISTYAALKSPTTFQQVAVQSFWVTGPMKAKMVELLDAKKGGTGFVVDWSRHDYEIPRTQIFTKADSQMLLEKVKKSGSEAVELRTAGEPGWGRWRAHTGTLLEALFPPPK
jgi:enterochelin esterase-like enzyme/outer membrane protein assembly factor BamB